MPKIPYEDLPQDIQVYFAMIDGELTETIYPYDVQDWVKFHDITSVRYTRNPEPDKGETPFQDILKLRLHLVDVKDRAEGVKARLELGGEPLAEAAKLVGYIVNDITNALDIAHDAHVAEKKARGRS